MRKIEWLEKFANEQSKLIKKTASVIKEDIIVDTEEFKNVKSGSIVNFNEKTYKVVNAEFVDEKGPGIVLREVEETEADGPEFSRTNPGDVYDEEIRDTVEQPAFEQAARETEQEILEDATKDITSIEGRYSNEEVKEEVSEVVEEVLEETTEVTEEVEKVEELETEAEEVSETETEMAEETEEVVNDPEELTIVSKKNRILNKILKNI